MQTDLRRRWGVSEDDDMSKTENELRKFKNTLDDATNANDRLAAFYHKLAKGSKEEQTRASFLELERKVHIYQEELLQAVISLFNPNPDKPRQL